MTVGKFVPADEDLVLPDTPHQSYDLGPYVDQHYVLLRRILKQLPFGIALEFGVGKGLSTQMIARHMPVIGFDSFQGLPEDWREGYPKGSFACEKPTIANAVIVTGMFEDTLRDLHWDGMRSVGLVHIDCDLYSSTKTVLDLAFPAIQRHTISRWRGMYVVFDEWHGYEGCEEHEQRAWREFAADQPNLQWDVVGHSFQQWAIRIK